MSGTNPTQLLAAALLCGWVAVGCSSGAHATASRPEEAAKTPVYLAQAVLCTQKDTTMSCCIKNNPTNAAEACGATAWEVAEVINGARVVNEAAQAAGEAAKAKEAGKDKIPEWKQKCLDKYNRCTDEDWLGTWRCIDCFRYCEGQQGNWPGDKCIDPET
jgi:hypothetical protein